MSYVIRILSLVNGERSSFDNEYVFEYDPHYTDPVYGYDGGNLVTTPDPDKALKFEDAKSAFELWRASHGTQPDGKPNRPLTAFTVEIVPVIVPVEEKA